MNIPVGRKSYGTRLANKNAHPGQIVLDQTVKRRTAAEVEVDRAKEAEAEQRVQAEALSKQLAIARKEDEQAQDDVDDTRSPDLSRLPVNIGAKPFAPPNALPPHGDYRLQ